MIDCDSISRFVPEWPLALHRHYSRREITAGVRYVTSGDKVVNLQGCILQLKDTKRELLFVTLDKSGKSFSPTTRSRDYASSPELFHWETQAAASVTRPSGRRYIESATTGWMFFLFVPPDPDSTFAFLGPITYESPHRGPPDRDHMATSNPDARRPLRSLRHLATRITIRTSRRQTRTASWSPPGCRDDRGNFFSSCCQVGAAIQLVGAQSRRVPDCELVRRRSRRPRPVARSTASRPLDETDSGRVLFSTVRDSCDRL
jgi:hypothetical protein